MATKQVYVTIQGKEHVSEVTEKAGAALTVFGKRIPLMLDPIRLLEIGLNKLREVIQGVKQYVLDSFDAYDRYASAQTRLAAQSKLTGVAMTDMNKLVTQARDVFGLGSIAAADMAISTARYAKEAGDASFAGKLMASALNLGAASGLTAAESAEALNQALKGSDEGLNKLGLHNPSSLWKEYADANGLAVGKMTETQKRLAELMALVDAGSKVFDTHGQRLQSAAGKQEQLNNQLEDGKVAFGAALQPARTLVINGLSMLVSVITPALVGLAKLTNFMVEVFVGTFRLAQSAVGSVIEVVGKLTGISALEQWGKRNSQAMDEYVERLVAMHRQGQQTNATVQESAKVHQLAAVQITAHADTVEKSSKRAQDASQAYFDKASKTLGAPLKTVIGMTEGAILSLAEAAQHQLPPDAAAKFDAHMQSLAANAKLIGERITAVPPAVEKGQQHTKKMADDVAGVARAALDTADAFGVINDQSAKVLNSVINIGVAIAKLAGGDIFSGLSGILGGVANVVSTIIGGDAERRRLQQQNNDALAKLSRDIGSLKLNITGEDFLKAQTALAGVVDRLTGGRGGANENDVRNALYAQGLTVEDFERIAKEFGIEVRSKSGALNVDSVRAVLTALNTTAPGRLGQDFADQLQFFRESQRLSGARGMTEVADLLAYLRNVGGVSALGGLNASDPTALRQQLFELFTSLNNGTGVSASALGQLSGAGLMSTILELIGLLDDLDGASPATSTTAPGTTAPGTTTATSPETVTAGGMTMSSESVAEVIRTTHEATARVLADSYSVQTRIAEATEGSYAELQVQTGLLRDLIDVCGGNVDRVNQALADARAMALANAGRGPSYG